jgi:hypothetical protein
MIGSVLVIISFLRVALIATTCFDAEYRHDALVLRLQAMSQSDMTIDRQLKSIELGRCGTQAECLCHSADFPFALWIGMSFSAEDLDVRE